MTNSCPVCRREHENMICPECGFDHSLHFEALPTLAPVPGQQLSVASLRAEWEHGSRVNTIRIEKKYYEGVYAGEIVNGQPNGVGILTCDSGFVYDGHWVEGRFEGQGKMTTPDALTCLEGQWKNFYMDGQGKAVYSNGDAYEGQWHRGQPHGEGKMTYANGNVYEGQWKGIPYKDDERFFHTTYHGYGKMTYAGGDIYEGQWEDNCYHGHGKMTYANGDVYEGRWERYTAVGPGKMTYANGDVYEGSWTDSTGLGYRRRDGWGIMTYANGDVYRGEWKNNHQHGKGKMTYANGDIYDGSWDRHKRSGQGKMFFANGDVFEGGWCADHPWDNDGLYTFADGTFYRGGYFPADLYSWDTSKVTFNGTGTFHKNGKKYPAEWIYGTFRVKRFFNLF